MKPTQITELLANIRKTFVSFFSILMFVALGVGVFLGISWAAPALQNAAQNVFDEGSFHNIQIQYPYGLTDDDLAKLTEVEGVSHIETARQSFQTVLVDGADVTVKVQTAGQDIDSLMVTEGELPHSADEIALHAISAEKLGAGVGDTITFEPDGEKGASAGSSDDASDKDTSTDASDGASDANESGMKYLTGRTFKVTGLVNSPDYIAKSSGTYGFSSTPSGSVDTLAWVTADAWDASAFQDAYPVVNIASDDLAGLATYDDPYKNASAEIEARISELGDELAPIRYDNLHDQVQKQVDEGEAKIAEGEEQIKEARQAVKDGKELLKEGKEIFEQAKAEAEAQLASASRTSCTTRARSRKPNRSSRAHAARWRRASPPSRKPTTPKERLRRPRGTQPPSKPTRTPS